PGHFLIGLPASGIHSNGYSLVRKIFFEQQGFQMAEKLPELGGKTLGEELLTPTRIYVSAVLPLLEKQLIDGISHITGGGFIENIPRMLPPQTT
ncbi:AIR synthase-related protein, partial [Enterococcus faecalis]